MARWVGVTCTVVLLVVGVATSARADKVTLANGDVLHGSVREEGDRVVLEHTVLGEVRLSRSDVLWITADAGSRAAGGVPSASAPTAFVPCVACPGPPAEAETKPKCKSPWEFAVGLNVVNDEGNTDKIQIGGDLETAYRWGVNRLGWRIQAFYEENSGMQTEGRVNSRLRYTRDVAERRRLFALWLVDRDDFADVQWRHGGFVGLQQDLIKGPKTTFSAALGAGGIVEKRDGFDWIETAAVVAQLDFEHEFEEGDSFEAMYYVVPYFTHTELSPMRLELRYAHPLRNHFDLTAAFLADYVPDPPGGPEALDTKFTFGVRGRP